MLEQFEFNKTQKLVLLNCLELMKSYELEDISLKDIAHACDISERTIFRIFETREGLLDALAEVITGTLNTPEVPHRISDLPQFVQKLFERFEENADFIEAAFQKEIIPRIRNTRAKERWEDMLVLVSNSFPEMKKSTQQILAANLRFLLCASSWRYYRCELKFSKKMTVDAVKFSVNALIQEGMTETKKYMVVF
tara:strand:- start:8127 stop:8711 length:585 start_codon:yes stop_codon:yes gene_type:complete